MLSFPIKYDRYVDKYFLRTKYILLKEHLNPFVKIRLFVRKPCKIYGLEESIEVIRKFSSVTRVGKIWSLKDGDSVQPQETIMVIEAPIQSIVDLETLYLGIISYNTTLRNQGKQINTEEITKKAKQLVALVEGRPISYFGARHWHWKEDAIIAKACFDGGFTACSTDIGASCINAKGIGTIPHVLETIYHWYYGANRAVVEATKAFDRWIIPSVPRIALIDYNNREIDDSLQCCLEIPNLHGIRVDTCGENIMQGSSTERGVSLDGVIALKTALNNAGYSNKKIYLTSGFGNIEKTKKFVDKEKELGYKLFDELGIGEMYETITTTADVVEVDGQEIHKVGRTYTPNPRLKRIV